MNEGGGARGRPRGPLPLGPLFAASWRARASSRGRPARGRVSTAKPRPFAFVDVNCHTIRRPSATAISLSNARRPRGKSTAQIEWTELGGDALHLAG